ncbi:MULTISPECIES: single-stranded DNA-binding protein [Desulfosporosinus]|uniref:Single-stranded DNA-binding protein n=2 Tax=Desulfosporosinus TaxID=79206 RepID=A0A1M5Q380_9FIRM|nr:MULTISPECIES: single-stranded DNA-binding protein [Desulfosporosinus]MDA8221833.1 single-stranded DNA-binding protein [Desulfitobacterium hafniense]MCO1601445.1 single-stranded DNA-binding protein [Desulfosporosinus nitroreducens]MCO5386216.1 single-stranded DNA-binding protein [Desulfosporosinus sp.]MDO0824025.1 single-stranded DNA-binding protein [Desulfosporosinus nitroreducens]SHH08432.1 single-strand DNA-binding protein [Desulfosporosinus lacus DSM 15449]
MLNRVVLIGRLTKDPELRYTPTGVAVANFTLAIDRNYKNAQGERDTDFINCVVYRQLAELCANYLAKGKLAAVDGRIQVRSYTGQDGQKRWVTEVIAEDVRFLSPKDGGSTESKSSGGNSSFGHEVNLDDDIPF